MADVSPLVATQLYEVLFWLYAVVALGTTRLTVALLLTYWLVKMPYFRPTNVALP